MNDQELEEVLISGGYKIERVEAEKLIEDGQGSILLRYSHHHKGWIWIIDDRRAEIADFVKSGRKKKLKDAIEAAERYVAEHFL